MLGDSLRRIRSKVPCLLDSEKENLMTMLSRKGGGREISTQVLRTAPPTIKRGAPLYNVPPVNPSLKRERAVLKWSYCI